MKRLCVFCGSALGVRAEYGGATRAVAAELAHRRLGLVYGGGSAGLMGVLADTELRLVDSMHERKATMAVLVDGFVALPGGLGTLEETLEILTWSQLGIHRKPVGILNTAGYYDSLLRLLGHALAEGFLRRDYLDLLLFADTPSELFDRLLSWQPPAIPRAWLLPSQT